jgi:hypothetical protein
VEDAEVVGEEEALEAVADSAEAGEEGALEASEAEAVSAAVALADPGEAWLE